MSASIPLLSSRDITELTCLSELRELMGKTIIERPYLDDLDPNRFMIKSDSSAIGIMAGNLPALCIQGVKVVSLSQNGHSGIMNVFDSRTGLVKGLLEAGTLTALRTAAVSARVSLEFITKDKITIIGILGAGRQAKAHIEAFGDLAPMAKFQIFARNKEGYKVLSDSLDISLREKLLYCKTPREAAKNANIICTVTRAQKPLLEKKDVPEHCHINAVGSCFAMHRELSGDLIASTERFVDSLPSARREAGDLLLAVKDGIISENAFAEEVGVIMRKEMVSTKGNRTLFKSLGLICEDLVFADYLFKKIGNAYDSFDPYTTCKL